jgi:DNA-binding protein HU-beta
MNMSELKKTIAESTGLSQADTDTTVKACFDAITDLLKNDDSINVPGFGSFSTGERAARTGRNPQTGESMQIAAAKTIKFKAGKALKDALNG